VTVGAPLHVHPLPSGFLGLSLEYRAIDEYGGKDPRAINPLLVHLIEELSPGQRPELRIGGDSADRAWWPGPGARKPLGAYIRLNRHWGAVAAALVHSTDARVILGLDLEADSAGTARVEATRLVAAIGGNHVQALELGNEPELYASFTWYHVDGHRMPGRAPGWDFVDYLREFSAIARALPRLPLAGPAAGSPKWLGYVGRFIAAEPRVGIVTLHRYPLQRCYIPPGAPTYPTIAHLLAPAATTGLADSVARDVALAHAHGRLVRIDEVNTISCGRVPAVGESFASALWVLQTLFAFARTGADGVNIHTYPSSPYSLFQFPPPPRRLAGRRAPRVLRHADVRPGGAAGIEASVDRRRPASGDRRVGHPSTRRPRPRGRDRHRPPSAHGGGARAGRSSQARARRSSGCSRRA
jgi:hypothetical protein